MALAPCHIVQYRLTIIVNTSVLLCGDALAQLVRMLRTIQIARGDHPWLPLRLTMAQLKAVMLLVQSGGMRSRELANGLRIAPPAATPLVDRLVKQKLARRVDDAHDRRIVWIRPTTRAMALHEKLLQTNRAVLADVIAAVPAADQKKVQESVRLLLDSAGRVLRLQPPGAVAARGRRGKRASLR